MSTAPSVQVNNQYAQIGMQFIAERMFFGGKEPAPPEREALRGQVSQRFAEAVERGELGLDASMEIGTALERLLGPRGKWLETPGCRLASVEVEDDDREDLRLPLELLRPPTGAEPVLVRCALAGTESAPEGPRGYPEGGRIVLATADAGGPVPDEALRRAVHEVCRTGLHLASGSEHDRKRGAFEPALDHLPCVSRAALRQALGPRDGRPGAAVLELVCHVREQGLCLHDDDSGEEVVVGAEALAAVLAPFVSHLRLVVLVPVAERPQGDPGRTLVDVALALHRRGLAAVVAPRVPLPAAASTGLTTALFGALLGDAEVAPASLERALLRANGYLSTKDRLAHLGLRLWAGAADGHDTRPVIIRPYRGLLSFEPEHARFYLGRTAETTQVVERLAQLHAKGQPRLVLLVGASGVGKSSLAKAGVVPALAKQGWAAILTRPAQHSGEELEALVEAQQGERRLVVVDQLEEVLTEADSHHEAGKYVQRLWALATREDVAVVATLRIDALDRGAELRVDPEGRRTLEQLVPGPHAVFVHHLDEDALREVIAEPARHVGLELDPGLVDRLCTEALAEPGALPMLELVLDKLWHRRTGQRLVSSSYQGGLAQQLEEYANACIDNMSESQRLIAKRILSRIATGPKATHSFQRRRLPIHDIMPERKELHDEFETVIGALVSDRIVVTDRPVPTARTSDTLTQSDDEKHMATIELAHELLVRKWNQLHEWIEERKATLLMLHKLEGWVEEWIQRGTLLTTKQLDFLSRGCLDENDVNSQMSELINTSYVSQKRRRRLRSTGAALLILISAILIWMMYQSKLQREYSATKTEMATLAEMRQMGAQASLLAQVPGREEDALRLALQAVTLGSKTKSELPSETLLGIHDAWSKVIPERMVLHGRIEGSATAKATQISGQAFRRFSDHSQSLLREILENKRNRHRVLLTWYADGLVVTTPDIGIVALDLMHPSRGQVLSPTTYGPWTERQLTPLRLMAVSNNGKMLATVSTHGIFAVWDLWEQAKIYQSLGEYERARIIQWSPDDQKILVQLDKSVQLLILDNSGNWTERNMVASASTWKDDSELVITKKEAHASHLYFPLEEILFDSALRSIEAIPFDNEPGHESSFLPLERRVDEAPGLNIIEAFTPQPEGSLVLFETTGGVEVYDTKQMRRVTHVEIDGFANIWKWSPKGTYFAVGFLDGRVEFWYPDGEKISELRQHVGEIIDMSWSYDSGLFSSLGEDGTVRIWDMATDRLAHILVHENVAAMAWDKDDTVLATSTAEGIVKLWDYDADETIWNSRKLQADEIIYNLSWSGNGDLIAAASSKGSVRVLDISSPISTPVSFESKADALSWSNDGRHLAVGTTDGYIDIWDRQESRVILRQELPSQRIFAVKWRHDDEYLLAISNGPTGHSASVMNRTGELVVRHDYSSGGRLSDAAWNGDDVVFGVVHDDDDDAVSGVEIRELSPATGVRRTKLLEPGHLVARTEISSTGTRVLLIGYRRNDHYFWDVSTAVAIGQLKISQESYESVNVSQLAGGKLSLVSWAPDGVRVAVVKDKVAMEIWQSETATRLASLIGHGDQIRGLYWSPTGDHLASYAEDGTLVLWDGHSGKKLATLGRTDGSFASGAWSSDGRRIASVDHTKNETTLKFWSIYPEDWVQGACDLIDAPSLCRNALNAVGR